MTKFCRTRCCIVGGGPAGVMLGFLLARAGVEVVVLEKHRDFFRDFRGDTIHPSTLAVIDQLGLMDGFRPLLQNEITTLDVVVNGVRYTPVDFSRLPLRHAFLGLMPQWDFLDFIAAQGRRHPGFSLVMGTEVTDLVWRAGHVAGVRATTADGDLEVSADLTVAADGRDSVVRRRAGMPVRGYGVPIDVLWFRLPKPADAPPPTLAYLTADDMVLTIDRGDYYQGGMLIPKGAFTQMQVDGLHALRTRLLTAAPFLGDVGDTLTSWEQVKLLSVQLNRLDRWHRPGVLCVGDAAHAMSPAFGVGVNYAVQDAIATANLLGPGLEHGRITEDDLAAVQRRRELPVRLMQPLQVALHRQVTRPGGLAGRLPPSFPAPVRALGRLSAPTVQTLAARLVGLGFRPERVADGDPHPVTR